MEDIKISTEQQASKSVPVLDAHAQVGGARFMPGVKWSTVIRSAQTYYSNINTPEKEAERIKKAKAFVEAINNGTPVPPPEYVRESLRLVEEALDEAHNNAYLTCCGRGSGGECCGNPEPEWDEADQRIMDVLAPIHRNLRFALIDDE